MSSSPSEARGSGRGKLILFGEHAVVYGKPAVAAGLPRGARAIARAAAGELSTLSLREEPGGEVRTRISPSADGERVERAFAAILSQFGADRPDANEPVDVDVTIEVPIGVGLGSSAALAVAVSRALASFFERPEKVDDAVEASERVFHGNPSGIDQLAAASGGLFFFSRGDGLESAPIEAPPLTLAVCQAGPAASTSEMVEGVAGLNEREPQLVSYLNMLMGDIARSASGALSDGDWRRVGELMDMNHGALSALGVTTAELDAACHTARHAGALGAKLTGAGGGGCVYALTPDGADAVLDAWAERGWNGFEVTIGAPDA